MSGENSFEKFRERISKFLKHHCPDEIVITGNILEICTDHIIVTVNDKDQIPCYISHQYMKNENIGKGDCVRIKGKIKLDSKSYCFIILVDVIYHFSKTMKYEEYLMNYNKLHYYLTSVSRFKDIIKNNKNKQLNLVSKIGIISCDNTWLENFRIILQDNYQGDIYIYRLTSDYHSSESLSSPQSSDFNSNNILMALESCRLCQVDLVILVIPSYLPQMKILELSTVKIVRYLLQTNKYPYFVIISLLPTNPKPDLFPLVTFFANHIFTSNIETCDFIKNEQNKGKKLLESYYSHMLSVVKQIIGIKKDHLNYLENHLKFLQDGYQIDGIYRDSCMNIQTGLQMNIPDFKTLLEIGCPLDQTILAIELNIISYLTDPKNYMILVWLHILMKRAKILLTMLENFYEKPRYQKINSIPGIKFLIDSSNHYDLIYNFIQLNWYEISYLLSCFYQLINNIPQNVRIYDNIQNEIEVDSSE
jgi:hypothetical protein